MTVLVSALRVHLAHVLRFLRRSGRVAAGAVPTFHDWPHRDRHGYCRCSGSCCTRVRTGQTVTRVLYPAALAGRPAVLTARRMAIVPTCPTARPIPSPRLHNPEIMRTP